MKVCSSFILLLMIFSSRTWEKLGVLCRMIYDLWYDGDYCPQEKVLCIQSIRGISVFLSFRTDRSWQTVQTQIRLLLEEQSDQGLHCLQFPLYLLDASPSCSTFSVITTIFWVSEYLGNLRYTVYKSVSSIFVFYMPVHLHTSRQPLWPSGIRTLIFSALNRSSSHCCGC